MAYSRRSALPFVLLLLLVPEIRAAEPNGPGSQSHRAALIDRILQAAGDVRIAGTGGDDESAPPNIAALRAEVDGELAHAHAPSRILVRFKNAATPAREQSAHEAARMQRRIKRFRSVPTLQLVEVEPDELADALVAYKAHPDVRYAEPDYEVHALEIPNDSSFGSLWGMHNTGQFVGGSFGTAGADIRAPFAWDLWTGDQEFRVAVIDSGVSYTHPDLAANMWTNEGEIPDNGIDDDGNGWIDDIHGYDFVSDDGDPMDDNQHGTHVAGTIGAVGNNGAGVVGVNWRCRIVALKFLGASGTGSTSGAIGAMDYVIANNIRVSNNSWGGGGPSEAMRDVIAQSQSIGHLFVAAAGNSAENNDVGPHYPSNYDLLNVIAVAATTNRDLLAGFSNYGATTVDLGAPGAAIYSTYGTGGYAYLSGTSMASPHVAGVVVLLMTRFPEMNWEEIRSRVLNTTRPVAALQGITVTGGIVNAAAALDDCNLNGQPDSEEIAMGTVEDCNGNLTPDSCEVENGFNDCNANGVPDECDVNEGILTDNVPPGGDDIPDQCQTQLITPSDDYPTIQDALDAAVDGDVVTILDGIHGGPGNCDLDPYGKKITIHGEHGPQTTVIDGGGVARGFLFHSGETRETILRDVAIVNGGAPTAGGIACVTGSSPLIQNCILAGNSTTLPGSIGGGAIFCDRDSNPLVVDSILAGNKTDNGAAISAANRSAPVFSNCLIAGNVATEVGAAVLSSGRAKTTLINSTVADNHAGLSGGGVAVVVGNVTLRNTILWGNTADQGPEVYLLGASEDFAATLVARHSDIKGGPDTFTVSGTTGVDWDESNLGSNVPADDPLFADVTFGTWTNQVAVAGATLSTLEDPAASFEPGALVGRLLNPDIAQGLAFPILQNSDTSITVAGDLAPFAQGGKTFALIDHRLEFDSPCIDAGTVNISPLSEQDINREPRVFGMTVDIGADEFVPRLVDGAPPIGSVDARQPRSQMGAAAGWDQFDLIFDGLDPLFAATLADFTVTHDDAEADPPAVLDMQSIGPDSVSVTLDGPISVGIDTCIEYTPSYSQACFGFLPGDVNGDRTVSPVDMLQLIDALNGADPTRPTWSTDIDRSEFTDSDDVARLLELFDGIDTDRAWLGHQLPAE